MMLSAGVAALAVGLWMPRAAEANCGHCDKMKAHACICQIEGVEKVVANTPDGVTVTFTAQDPAVVKKLQEAAAKLKDCACGKCAGKPGCKCPKCAKKAKCTGKPDCKCPHCAKKGDKK
jgi:hypothetical protein